MGTPRAVCLHPCVLFQLMHSMYNKFYYLSTPFYRCPVIDHVRDPLLSNDCYLGVVAACNSVATNCREQYCVRAAARVKNYRLY